jgi:hypothetical protein
MIDFAATARDDSFVVRGHYFDGCWFSRPWFVATKALGFFCIGRALGKIGVRSSSALIWSAASTLFTNAGARSALWGCIRLVSRTTVTACSPGKRRNSAANRRAIRPKWQIVNHWIVRVVARALAATCIAQFTPL